MWILTHEWVEDLVAVLIIELLVFMQVLLAIFETGSHMTFPRVK